MPLMDSLKAMLWRNDHSRVIKTELRNLRVPFTFRPGTSDVAVLRKVFLESEYELPFTIPVRTVVDAGAHIGAATVFYHYRFPDARILAIEPGKAMRQRRSQTSLIPLPQYQVLRCRLDRREAFQILSEV